MAAIQTQDLADLLAVLKIGHRTVADLSRMGPTPDVCEVIAANQAVIAKVESELARRERLAVRLLDGAVI